MTTGAEVDALNARASVLMKHGLRLMEQAGSTSVSEALACFDQALALRRGLPVETSSTLCYGLAACWLNRADALMRLVDPQAALALQAYDEALALLQTLPLADDARFPRRLAIAQQNRGLVLHAQGAAAPAAAISALTDAIATLDHDQASRVADRPYLLAAVWTNLAGMWTSQQTVESDRLARDAARRALALVADLETHDSAAAEVGLKARHAMCQALAQQLSEHAEMGDDVHDATDLVEDGLAVARRWQGEGGERVRALASDLFRFGAGVYRKYQPHFLDEFVGEHADFDA